MGKTSKQRAICSIIAGFLVTTGAGIVAALSLFYLPVAQDLGFSQAKFAIYVSVMSLCGVISNPVMGKVFSSHMKKIRLITLLGGLVAFTLCLLFSFSSRLWQFIIIGGLLSFMLPFSSSMLGISVVSRWLTTARSIGIAIVAIGTSAGTVIHSKVISLVITEMGWRAGYVAEGLLLLVFYALAALLMSPPPEYLGMKPWGEDEEARGEKAEKAAAGFSEIAKMPAFWFVGLAAGVGCIFVMFIQQSIIPMLQVDFAMKAATAATVLSAYSIVCACFKPITGVILKKFSKTVSILYVGLLVAAAAFAVFVSRSPVVATAGIILIAAGNMFGTVLLPSLVTDFFGAKMFPVVMGYVNIFFTLGGALAPVIMGRTYDITGSYHLVYLFICILSLVTMVLLLMAGRKKSTSC